MKRGRAILIHRYGPPNVLTWSEVELRPLAPRELRIRMLAAAVNHTDLEIRSGNWPVRRPDPFPYVPGVEAVGVIEELGDEVQEWTLGQNVITMMQGLGGVRAERPGGYAEFVTIDADAALSDLLLNRAIRLPEYRTMPVSEARQAHEALERGAMTGRLLLTVLESAA